jgi:methionine salvage enolase-phosphatase E1
LAVPIIFIYLVLVDFETTVSPFAFAHSLLQPYFTSGSIEYCEITYDIVSDLSSYCKTVHQTIKDLKNSFAWEHVVVSISTHTDNDLGDPFSGYSLDGEKHYAGTPTEDVSFFFKFSCT